MAQVGPPPSVKLFCGMICAQAEMFARARRRLETAFGPVDLESPVMPFDMTDYYAKQMGRNLLRRFVSFERLVRPDRLVSAKVRTNRIEADFTRRYGQVTPRPINLDPGYITEASLVLATMKNFSHRIYLARGVYGDLTLMYRRGRWEKLPWTFPDYASGRYDEFLVEARWLLSARKREEQK